MSRAATGHNLRVQGTGHSKYDCRPPKWARLRHQVDPLVQTSDSGLADTEEAGMSRRALRPVHEVRVYGPAEVIEGVVTVSRLMRRCVRPIEIVRIHPGDHDWFFYSLENRVSDPRELTFRTLRVQRNLLDRLKGYRRAYETQNYLRPPRGRWYRGSTPDTSKAAAQRRWIGPSRSGCSRPNRHSMAKEISGASLGLI